MRQIWKEYFQRLLNVEDGWEAVFSTVGVGMRGRKIKRDREDECCERGGTKSIKENDR